MSTLKHLKKAVLTAGIALSTLPSLGQNSQVVADSSKKNTTEVLQEGFVKQLKKFLRIDGKMISDLHIVSLSDTGSVKKGTISFSFPGVSQVVQMPFVYAYDQAFNGYRPQFERPQLVETAEGKVYEIIYTDHDGVIDMHIQEADRLLLERMKKLTQTTLRMDSSALNQLDEFHDIHGKSLTPFFQDIQVSSLLEKNEKGYKRVLFSSSQEGIYQDRGEVVYNAKGDLIDQDSLTLTVLGKKVKAQIEDSIGNAPRHTVFIIDFNEADLVDLENTIREQQEHIISVINKAVSGNHAEEVMPALKKNKLDKNYESTIDPSYLSFPREDGVYRFTLHPTKKLFLDFVMNDNQLSFRTLAGNTQEVMLQSTIKKDQKEENIYYLASLSSDKNSELSFKTITEAEYLESYHRPHFVAGKEETLPQGLRQVENLSLVADRYDPTTKTYALYTKDGLVTSLPLEKKTDEKKLTWDLLEEDFSSDYSTEKLFSSRMFKEGYLQSIGLSTEKMIGPDGILSSLLKESLYKPKEQPRAVVYEKDSLGLYPVYYTFEQSKAGKDIVVQKDQALYGNINRVLQKVLVDMTVLWIMDHNTVLIDKKLNKTLSQSQGLKLLPVSTEEKIAFLSSIDKQREFKQLLSNGADNSYTLVYSINDQGKINLKDVVGAQKSKQGSWKVEFGSQHYYLSLDSQDFSYKTDHTFYGDHRSKSMKLVCEDIPEKLK